MRMINASNDAIMVEGFGPWPAGEVREIADGYCVPRRAKNNARIPSAIELLAPQLRPEDDADYAEWKKVPSIDPKPFVPPTPTADDLVAQGVAPGVAAIMAGKAAADEGSSAEPEPEEAVKGKRKIKK